MVLAARESGRSGVVEARARWRWGAKGMLFSVVHFCAANFMLPNFIEVRTNDSCYYGSETPIVNGCIYFPSVSGL
jgi:hypothetical protein